MQTRLAVTSDSYATTPFRPVSTAKQQYTLLQLDALSLLTTVHALPRRLITLLVSSLSLRTTNKRPT